MSKHIHKKIKRISSFEILPNEILLHIFRYLTSNEIIYSFIDCNQRLQHLLLTQKYHFKIPRKNLDFWNKALPIIGSQIQTFIINIDYLTVSLDFFSNLTSIIISSPYSLLDGQLTSILNHQCFQQLHTFKIKDTILSEESYYTKVLNDEQILFKKIFDNNNNLQVFEYLPELRKLSYQNLDQLNSKIHIRSLTLNLTHFYDTFTLIQNTPNLIYLNIQSETLDNEFEEYCRKSISEIKLEAFYLKLKPRRIGGYPRYHSITALDQLFDAIQLFSSSLITLSLNFIDTDRMDLTNFLYNGIELEKKLSKSIKKLQNFYFYAKIGEYKNIPYILSTFEKFPWSIAVHENGDIYSLPFPFHELKYFRDFQDVLSNNDEILKNNDHQLWQNVRSLELFPIDLINSVNLFPLIKLNMPKLSSITFCDNIHYDSGDSCDEIERINVQLDSVTTVSLKGITMKKFQQILMYSFPNLQCLILDHTELPSKENQLTSFLGRKIPRIETDESSLHEKDFSYLSNLKHLKLTYLETYAVIYNPEKLNYRSRTVSNLLAKIPKLETLSIYVMPSDGYSLYNPTFTVRSIMDGFNKDEINAQYEIKYSAQYMRFIRNTIPSSF